jgi:hypothetical protein
MRCRMLLMGLAVLCLVGLSSAQYRNTSPAGDPGTYFRNESKIGLNSLRGLLDPNRVHMSNSMSFGYASIGGRGFTQGLYMNHMQYQISQPLSVTTHLGYQFQPSGPAAFNPGLHNGNFVGGADLNWRPTQNTDFRLSVYRGMYSPSPYSYYGWSPYDYNPYFVHP